MPTSSPKNLDQLLDGAAYKRVTAAEKLQIASDVIQTAAHVQAAMFGVAPTAHVHGNISNAGKIGSTANIPVVTGTDGLLQAASKITFADPVAAVLGDELITSQTDRDFSVDAGNWSGTNWSVVGGKYTHAAGSAVAATLSAYAPTAGLTYLVSIDFVMSSLHTVTVAYGGASKGWSVIPTATTRTIQFIFTAINTDYLTVTPQSSLLGSIDNISIKQLTASVPQQVILSPASATAIEVRPCSGTAMGVGPNCLKHNVTGTNLLAIGLACLQDAVVDGNIAAGINCLKALTNGVGNVAFGIDCLMSVLWTSYNTAGGYNALRALTAGSYYTSCANNTAFGAGALEAITEATNTTALGMNAGKLITAGTSNLMAINCLYLGYDTRSQNIARSNEIVIGAEARGNGDNTVTLGNTSITTTYLQGTVSNATVLNQTLVEATLALNTGSSMLVNVPANALVIGIRFRVDVTLTSGDGATNWQATLSGGSTESIVTAQSLIKNIDKSVWSGYVKCTATTQITIDSATGTLNGGTVRAQVKYIPAMTAYANL